MKKSGWTEKKEEGTPGKEQRVDGKVWRVLGGPAEPQRPGQGLAPVREAACTYAPGAPLQTESPTTGTVGKGPKL